MENGFRFKINAQITAGPLRESPGGKYTFLGEGSTPEAAQAAAQEQLDRTVQYLGPITPPTIQAGPVEY